MKATGIAGVAPGVRCMATSNDRAIIQVCELVNSVADVKLKRAMLTEGRRTPS